MKRSIVGLLSFLPIWAQAQDVPNALLWSISGMGLPANSFVYGTIHSKDERAFTYVDAVESRMRTVSTVAGELDLDNAKLNSMAVMNMMMMPDGKTLEELYSKKEWKEVQGKLKADLGIMAGMVMRMKPFFVMATMSESAMREDRSKTLDDHFLAQAKANGHRTFGIETVAEQMRAMDALSLKEQAAMLLDHVRNKGYDGLLDNMMDAYARQDLAALMAIMGDGVGGIPKQMEKALLDDRNQVMVHRMDSVMRADNGALFLVGAAHLPGERGVLQLLRGRGFVVESVAIEPNAPAPTFPPAMFLKDGIRYTNDSLGFSVDMPDGPRHAGNNMVGSKENGSGVLVIVEDDELDLGTIDLAAFIAEHYGGTEVGPLRTFTAQGIEAQVFAMDMKGTPAEIMVLQKGGRTYFVASSDKDPQPRKQGIDSFRFTDLPE
jgi:uncharacterized protein YbaP (TraB family)